jgi:hypothetical protein
MANPLDQNQQPVEINKQQIDRLKTDADQYGGYNDPRFKTAIDTQYGSGSFDKFNTHLRGQYERLQNPQPVQQPLQQQVQQQAQQLQTQAAPIQEQTQIAQQLQTTAPVTQPMPVAKVETPKTQQEYQV